MRPGSCEGQPVLDVVSAFQSYGKFLEQGATPEAERIRLMTVRNSCRKDGGSCGGEWRREMPVDPAVNKRPDHSGAYRHVHG